MTRRGKKGGEYLWARVVYWYGIGSPQAMVLRGGVTWRERWGAWPPGRGGRGAGGVGWDRVRTGAAVAIALVLRFFHATRAETAQETVEHVV